MDQSVCKLTIVCPPAVTDNIIALMTLHGPPVAGFTTFAAEGHGMSFDSASVGERVRGRVQRSVVVTILPRGDADRLVELVRLKIAVPHMSYWIEPVLACGRMGELSPSASSVGAATAEPEGAV